MKKKFFNVFLSFLTIITQINLPVNAVAEEPVTGDSGDDSGVTVNVDQEDKTDEENNSNEKPTEKEESSEEANPASETENTETGEDVDGEDPFTYEVSYDEEFSKATITISYGKEDADYIDLDNADVFQEKADNGVIAVNEEKTNELSLAFDVTENGDYDMKVSAYKGSEVVSNSEKTVSVTDIKTKEIVEEVKEEETTLIEETIAEASISDIAKYIKNGKSFAFFIGNKTDDELWQRILAAYSKIQDEYSNGYDATFYELQGEGNISSITNLAVGGVSLIKAAYKDLTEGTTGNGVVCFTYNGKVVYITKEYDDTDEYTVEEQAIINFLSKYSQINLESTENSEDNISLASTGTTYDLKTLAEGASKNVRYYVNGRKLNNHGTEYIIEGIPYLYYTADNKLQSFTAPESGTYYVTLTGANGDSDSGVAVDAYINYSADDDGKGNAWTAGTGGQGGAVTGYIYLEKGQTIYLSLGYMNGMGEFGDGSGTKAYGQGGAGYGVERGFRAGGGGAAAIYTEAKGNGELKNYGEGNSSILMVAGGGGGAEDFYTASWDYNNYYCSYNECSNAKGGNGGKNPTTGSIPAQNNAVGAVAESGAYTGGSFGDGQDYATPENASSGGGGAGYWGGKSANTPGGTNGSGTDPHGHTIDLLNHLRGGTGAGGYSYINESVITNSEYHDGDNSDFNLWPSNEHSSATIQLVSLDEHTLTINYYDVNSSTNPIASGKEDSTATKIAESKTLTLTAGESYNETSPTIDGYSITNVFAGKVDGRDDDSFISGTMPDSDVVINVYYDYSQLTINYYEWDVTTGKATTTKVADTYNARIKKGDTYNVNSPTKDGYVFYYENSSVINADGVTNNDGHFSNVVSGTKSGADQTYNVYYVKPFSSVKHIQAVNGVAISEDVCEAGVQLKEGDVVTYRIDYQNNQYEAVTKTITDNLPSGLQYVDGSATNDTTHRATTTSKSVVWNVDIKGTSSAKGKSVSESVLFKAKVVSANTDADVQNWGRPDTLIKYTAVKSSDPVTDSEVTTNDFITYTITVKNTGSHTVNNIVVVDEIPTYTEFASIDNDSAVNFNGVSRNGYVKFVIDELVAGGTAKLKFTVRATAEGSGTTKEEGKKIINVARYQNYQVKQNKDDNSKDQNILNNGNKTNETIHYLLGAKIVAIKTSNPVSGSTVKANDTIHYAITTTNEGKVRANYVRVTDDIPSGTTYVPGSLKLSGDTGSYVATPTYSIFGYTGGISISADTSTKTIHHDAEWSDVLSKTRWQPYKGTMIPGGSANPPGVMSSDYQLVNADEKLVYWSSYISVANCSQDTDSSHYGNSNYHYKEVSIWISSDGTNFEEIKSTRVYNRDVSDAVSADSNSYGTNVKKIRLMGEQPGSGGYCWNSVTGYVDVQYKKITKPAYDETITITNGYSISNANINVSGGTVKNVIVTSNNSNWNVSDIDTSVWNVSADGGTLTLTPKKIGSVENVSSAQINTALSKIKWTGATAPNATVTVNGENVQTGYADSSNSCRYVTTNGTPYVECIGTNVDTNDQMVVEFDVTVNNNLPSSFEIKNVGKYSTYQTASGSGKPSTAGSDTTKPTDETNETVHYLQNQVLTVEASKSSNPVSGSKVNKNQTITYYLTFKNTGNATIKYLQVRDAIPEFTSFAYYASDDGVYSQGGNYVEWVLKDLKAGESRTVSFNVTVNKNFTSSDEIINVAKYEIFNENPGEPGDIKNVPTKETNKVVHTTNGDPINPEKPSTIAVKSSNPVSGSYVHRQDEIEYTITLTNSGEGTQDFTLVEDKIPTGTTFKEIKEYSGASNSPDLEVRKYYDSAENSVKYIVANLASGDSIQLHFVVTVDKEIQVSEIKNVAKYLPLAVASSNDQKTEISLRKLNDSTTVNFQTLDIAIRTSANETNSTVHYLYQPNVTAVKSSNPETNTVVARGSQITYTLTVTNNGEDVANYVNIADVIPTNTTYVDGSVKTSNRNDKSGIASVNGNVSEVQYVLYDLAVGETRTVSFTVTVNKDCQSGAFINNVAVYDNYEINHGDPGKDNFIEPSTPTNETIHTVEIDSDIIMTGGQGWSNYLPYVGGGLIGVALIVILIASKKKKEEK